MTKTPNTNREKTTTPNGELPQRWVPIIRSIKEARKGWMKRLAKEAQAEVAQLFDQIETTAREEPLETTVEPVGKEDIKGILKEALKGLEGRVTKIDEDLGKLRGSHVQAEQKGGVRTYSQAVATPIAFTPQGQHLLSIQVDIEDNERPTDRELLTRVQRGIPDAKAVKANHRVLGRVEVVMPTALRKEQVLKTGLEADAGLRLIRKPLQVMLVGIPLETEVTTEDSTTNTAFLKEVNKANSTEFTRVEWLYKPRKLQELRTSSERSRGSLILSTFTRADQQKIVTKGCFYAASLYEGKLWSQECRRVQCFRCWKWGHTQAACNHKDDTCGHCAGNHSTRDCKTKEISTASCAACKQKGHFAWMTSRCQAFEKYTEVLRQKETDLRRATAAARTEEQVASEVLVGDGWTTVNNNGKRRRQVSGILGRPTDISIAARDSSQSKLIYSRHADRIGLRNQSRDDEEQSRPASPMDTTMETALPTTSC